MITSLRVTGMTCNGCVKHVTEALKGVPGVTAVEVDLAGARAKVVHGETVTTQNLLAAIDEAGYAGEPTPA